MESEGNPARLKFFDRSKGAHTCAAWPAAWWKAQCADVLCIACPSCLHEFVTCPHRRCIGKLQVSGKLSCIMLYLCGPEVSKTLKVGPFLHCRQGIRTPRVRGV